MLDDRRRSSWSALERGSEIDRGGRVGQSSVIVQGRSTVLTLRQCKTNLGGGKPGVFQFPHFEWGGTTDSGDCRRVGLALPLFVGRLGPQPGPCPGGRQGKPDPTR